MLFHDLKVGIVNRYPLCCIIHYCLDVLLKCSRPAVKRGVLINGNHVYVPCILHKKQSIPICDCNGVMFDLSRYFEAI